MKSTFKLTTVTALAFLLSHPAVAHTFNTSFLDKAHQALASYSLDCSHWYVGGNLGMSHLRDNPNPGSNDSVDENGPGGSVLAGYQWNSMFGTEMGYTQYKNSRETSGPVIIAKTEHYAVDVAGTMRYPLYPQWSALGKLGAAYSYAQKMAVAAGTAKSASAGSIYWGLGLDFSVTPKVDLIAQFAQAGGNHLTGTTDLWSLGANFAIT